MSLSNLKKDLVTILSGIDGVSVSYDYSTIEESAKSIVIDSLDISYEHDIDMGYHKMLRAVAVLICKTDEDLDALVDALEDLDNETEGNIRDIMMESYTIENNDMNLSIATANLSCLVWD